METSFYICFSDLQNHLRDFSMNLRNYNESRVIHANLERKKSFAILKKFTLRNNLWRIQFPICVFQIFHSTFQNFLKLLEKYLEIILQLHR